MIYHPLMPVLAVRSATNRSARKFEQITGGKLVEGYGLTEASPVTHANLLWDGIHDKR